MNTTDPAPPAAPVTPPAPLKETPVSVLNWLGTFLLLCIPLLNIILVIYWALSDTTAASKRNFFRAYIIAMVVFLILGAICGVLAFALFGMANGFSMPPEFQQALDNLKQGQ